MGKKLILQTRRAKNEERTANMSKYHEREAKEASDDEFSGEESDSGSFDSFVDDRSEAELTGEDSAPEVTTHVRDRKKSKDKSKSKSKDNDKKAQRLSKRKTAIPSDDETEEVDVPKKSKKNKKDKEKKSKKNRVSDSDDEDDIEVEAEADVDADVDMAADDVEADKKKKKSKKSKEKKTSDGDASPVVTDSDKKDAEKTEKLIKGLEERGFSGVDVVQQSKHGYSVGRGDMTASCLPGLFAKAQASLPPSKDGQTAKEFTDAEIDALFPKLCACKTLAQAESQFNPLETLIWAVLNFWPGLTKDSALRLAVWGVVFVSGKDVKVKGFARAGMEPGVAGGPSVIAFGRPGCTIRYMDNRPNSKCKDKSAARVTFGSFCELKDTLSTLGKNVEEVIATGPLAFFLTGPKKLPRPPVEVKGASKNDVSQMLQRRGPAIAAPPVDDNSPAAIIAGVGTALADAVMPSELKDLGEGSVFELTLTPKDPQAGASCLKAMLLKYLDALRSLNLPPKPTVLLSPAILQFVKGTSGLVASDTLVSEKLGHVAFVGSSVPISDANGANLRGSASPVVNPVFANTIFVLAAEPVATEIGAAFAKVGANDTHTITVHPIPKLPSLNF